MIFFFFSSRRRHTRSTRDWSSDVCSSDLVVTDFNVARINNEQHKLVSWDEKEVGYDLLVTVPTNMGDPAIERSGLGDELNLVPTNRHTLQSKQHQNIFVIGDATDLPSSKAGSVAHFESEVLAENIVHYIKGEPLDSQ